MKKTRSTKIITAGALLLAGFGGGAALAATGSASAATSAVTSAAQKVDPTKSMRSDEHLLTGTTAAKVKAAALAKSPGATIQRVETDSDGVYEAHVVTKAGVETIIQVGKDFKVTGTQAGGGHGDHDGDGPGRAESGTAG